MNCLRIRAQVCLGPPAPSQLTMAANPPWASPKSPLPLPAQDDRQPLSLLSPLPAQADHLPLIMSPKSPLLLPAHNDCQPFPAPQPSHFSPFPANIPKGWCGGSVYDRSVSPPSR
jgi:hypothetical protein